MAEDKLTAKEALFVEEYLKDRNATQAAIRAGYSERTAAQLGYQLLRRPRVAAAIARAIEERSIRNRITADDVLQQLARIGFGDLRKVATWSGKGVDLRNSEELDDDAAGAIREVKQTAEGVGVKLHNPMPALKLLGQHVGLFGGVGDKPPGDDAPGSGIAVIPADSDEWRDLVATDDDAEPEVSDEG